MFDDDDELEDDELDEVTAQYVFRWGVSPVVAERHRLLRLSIGFDFGGCVPGLPELQEALQKRGMAVTLDELQKDIDTLKEQALAIRECGG